MTAALMKIALLLRGFHFLWKDRFGFPMDGRRFLDSLTAQIVEPLRENHTVDLFLATYPSPVLEDITGRLQPRAMILPDPKTSNQMNTFIGGLELIEKQETKYDRIISTRFDLKYIKSIENWNIWEAKSGIYFPFREYEKAWKAEHYTGDAIHVIDEPYVPLVKKASTSLRRQVEMHHLYDSLAPLTPNLYFIEEGHYDSNSLYWNRECRNPLYRIGNRPRLPISQPYDYEITKRPLTFRERIHWKVATLFLRPTAWVTRLLFRPGIAKS